MFQALTHTSFVYSKTLTDGQVFLRILLSLILGIKSIKSLDSILLEISVNDVTWMGPDWKRSMH